MRGLSIVTLAGGLFSLDSHAARHAASETSSIWMDQDMDHENRYMKGWNGEPDGAQPNDVWAEYYDGDDNTALKNMGQQENLSLPTITSSNDTKTNPPLVPGPSQNDDGSFSHWDYDIFDNMMEPDLNDLHLLGLHALGAPGSACFENEPEGSNSFGASASNQQTPSLTMSPYTSFKSETESFADEDDNQLWQSVFLNDQWQEHAESSGGKSQHTLKAANSTTKGPSKGTSANRTSVSNSIECRECSKRFPRRCDLRKHQKAVHISQGSRPHACSFCDKRFIWPKDVKRHEERVHGKAVATRNAQASTSQEEGTGSREDVFDLKMPDVPETDFELFSQQDLSDDFFDPDMQQDWLCSNNNPAHHTFSRTHSPGEGSAPHRGARV
ncbi:hypothetical protein PRZ48_003215 [Zasmidium cellare]|uniref:C2H2-type domain-containing protein n=1 Tax=Zasmidium cellare TaxID=395010 RepID=A0ABR0EUS6_ZASCE|nr:hypothetical protein PRZ48_003215 [Zasmidium cellare]